MPNPHVLELVKWHSAANVSDQAMIDAVDGILPDLKEIPGFISQVLYKDKDGAWIDLYLWQTEEQAIASNDLMADKPSFATLISLIEPETVSIEFLYLPTHTP